MSVENLHANFGFRQAPWRVPESSHNLVGIPLQKPVKRSYDQHLFGIAKKVVAKGG